MAFYLYMISIIIPAYNEALQISKTVKTVLKNCSDTNNIEIIISDGKSTDNTIASIQDLPIHLVSSPIRGRAAQMNYGAGKAKGEILFFLHADTIPPKDFDKIITDVVSGKCKAGSFRLRFDHDHWFLKFHSWFTRFNINPFRFGDQGMFIQKSLFKSIKGFDEKYLVFEDQEIIARIKQNSKFCIPKYAAITSARKYLQFGIYKTQLVYYRIYFLYKSGVSQEKLMALYKRLLH